MGKGYAKTVSLLCFLNVLSFALNSSFTQLTSYIWIIFTLPPTLMLEVSWAKKVLSAEFN